MFSFPPIARPVYDELVESSSVPSSSPSRIFTSSPVKSPNKSNPGDSPMLPSVSHTPASSPRKHDFSGTRQSSQPISVPPLRSPDTVSVGAIGRWPASAQIGEYPDFTRTFVELNPPPAAHTLPSLAGIFRQAHVFPADLPLSSPPPAMHSPVRSLPASQNSWRSLSNEDVPVDEEKQSPYVQDNFLARQIKPLHDATLLNTIGQPDTAKPVASYHSITTDVVPVQAPGLSDHVSRTESLNKVSSTLTKAPCLPSETREDQAPLDDPPACDPTSRKRKAPTDVSYPPHPVAHTQLHPCRRYLTFVRKFLDLLGRSTTRHLTTIWTLRHLCLRHSLEAHLLQRTQSYDLRLRNRWASQHLAELRTHACLEDSPDPAQHSTPYAFCTTLAEQEAGRTISLATSSGSSGGHVRSRELDPHTIQISTFRYSPFRLFPDQALVVITGTNRS
jgi:hypothetical protein